MVPVSVHFPVPAITNTTVPVSDVNDIGSKPC